MLTQIFDLLDKKQKKDFWLVFVVIVIAGFFEMLGVSVMLPLVQVLTYPAQLYDRWYIKAVNGIIPLDETGIVVLVGASIVIVYLVKNAFVLFANYYQMKFRLNLQVSLTIKAMKAFLCRPYEYYVDNNSSDVIRGVSTDISNVNGMVEHIMKLFTEILTVTVIGVYLFIQDPVMACGVLVVGAICALAIVTLVKKRLHEMGRISWKADEEFSRSTIEITQGIKDIYVMQKRKYFLDRFERIKNTQKKANLSLQVAQILPERFIEFFCIFGIIVVVVGRYISGVDMTTFVAKLAVFAVAAFRILPSISRMSGNVSMLVFLNPALGIAHDNIVSTEEALRKNEAVLTLGDADEAAGSEFKDSIEAKGVTWKYSTRDYNVLEELSLKVKAGQAIGIIGESGSGKSTLSDILLGLYVPQQGSVEFDGHSVFDNPVAWSKIMGYVPQMVYLLDNTIRANVAFGEENIDDAKVWKALEMANLDKYVRELPEGLDAMVGESGIRLSGGQRQRLAIARALYFEPCVLILDEATSALDNDTEAAVMDAITRLQGSITMIIIAHRINTLRNCDAIYEITGGKAVERNKRELFENV